jgi:hypothetical protein
MGYRDGDRAMYVSPYNNLDEVLHVSDDIRASWSSLWQESSDEFDYMLEKDSDLSRTSPKGMPEIPRAQGGPRSDTRDLWRRW